MTRAYLYIVISSLLSSFIVFGGRVFGNLGFSLFEITAMPLLVVFVILFPLAIKNPKFIPNKTMSKKLLAFGFFDSIAAICQYAAVLLGTPVGIAVMLLYTQPLWTIFINKFILEMKISKNQIIATILVIIGIIILVNPFANIEIDNFWGIVIALIGGISLSAWIIMSSAIGQTGYSPVLGKFWQNVVALIFIFAFFIALGKFLPTPGITDFSFAKSPELLFYIVIFGTFAFAINHLLYLEGMKKIPSSKASIILLLEPVGAVILAAIFLDQPITLFTIFGSILILSANYLVIKTDENHILPDTTR